MIEFYGSLSEKCIVLTEKRNAKRTALIFTAFAGVALIITLVPVILGEMEYYKYLCLVVFLALIDIIMLATPSKSRILRLPRKVTLDNNTITIEIESLHGNWPPKVNAISQVKAVIDDGEWYHIIFHGDTGWWWVCQKNLITKGNLDEFEKLFEGKITKK